MDDLSVPSGVQYAVPYVPSVRTCKCGTKYRVDCENPGGFFALQRFQHCSEDDGEYLSGPLLRAYEQHDGKWVQFR
jgi:hypothetical protein